MYDVFCVCVNTLLYIKKGLLTNQVFGCVIESTYEL